MPYKIIYEDFVIDAVKKPIYFKFLSESKASIITDKDNAHGILSSNRKEKYLISGRKRPEGKTWKEVSLIYIDEKEYTDILEKLGKVKIPASSAEIVLLKKDKISQLSTECNKKLQMVLGSFFQMENIIVLV